jgi:hypothetical protein
METKELEVYSEATNSSIVRMPSRRFPGVVIQGDSLSIFFHEAMALVEALADSEDEETFLMALESAEKLEEHLLHYEHVLRAHGIELPYIRDPTRSASQYASRWGTMTPNPRFDTDPSQRRFAPQFRAGQAER